MSPSEIRSSDSSQHRLRLRGITKTFGATRALDGVDLAVMPGEVHAIIGENGAGKSTLMKILSGATRPDRGEIWLDGQPLRLSDPRQSIDAGIAMIYQELNLAPDLTVADNIVLGDEPTVGGWISRRRQREIAIDALNRLGIGDVDPDRRVGSLPIAQQQMVEIARAVRARAVRARAVRVPGQRDESGTASTLKVLILDEPTSSLTRDDTRHLMEVIATLASDGVSVLYISHFLEECESVADTFTVLRDGRSVGSGRLAGSNRVGKHMPAPEETPTSIAQIVRLMVGRDVDDLYPSRDRKSAPRTFGPPVLRLDAVSGADTPADVTLEIRRGEIFGLAGLVGAGRTETLRCLFGLDEMTSGTVRVHERESSHRDPGQRWRIDAMGLVSENRKEEGLLLQRSLTENLTLTRLRESRWNPWTGDSSLRAATQRQMDRLQVKADSPDQTIGELSGGNQQKIALGRLMHHPCEIWLLDEPTRGIDIGSKQVIYQAIDDLARSGKTILMVSSYLPELLGVCDTIGVMSRGRLVASRPAARWTEHDLLRAALGTAATTADDHFDASVSSVAADASTSDPGE